MEESGYQTIVGGIRRSLSLGPISTILSSISFAILYPLVVRGFGFEVLGIWGLIAAVAAALRTADIGFSLQIQRDASPESGERELLRLRQDIAASRGIYALLWGASLLLIVVLRGRITSATDGIYPSGGVILAVILATTAAWLGLSMTLDRAALVGLQDAPFTFIVASVPPTFTLAVGIPGTLLGWPLEALGAAMTLGAFVSAIAMRMRLQRCHPAWTSIPGSLIWLFRPRRALRFAVSGRGFYFGAVGMLLRQPVIRFVASGVAGLAGAAAIDIALRASDAARGLAVAGSAPLLSGFAELRRQSAVPEIERLCRDTLVSLCLRAGLPLATLIALSPHAQLWLGEPNSDVVTSLQLIAIWAMITVVNVPFWFLLQASEDESYAAMTVWIHAGSLLLLVPMADSWASGTAFVAGFWLAGGIATQVAIFARVSRRHLQLKPIFGDPAVVRSLGLVVMAGATGLCFAVVVGQSGGLAFAVLVWAVAGASYLVLARSIVRLNSRGGRVSKIVVQPGGSGS